MQSALRLFLLRYFLQQAGADGFGNGCVLHGGAGGIAILPAPCLGRGADNFIACCRIADAGGPCEGALGIGLLDAGGERTHGGVPAVAPLSLPSSSPDFVRGGISVQPE